MFCCFTLALLSCSISQLLTHYHTAGVQTRGKQAEVVLATRIRSSFADGVLADGAVFEQVLLMTECVKNHSEKVQGHGHEFRAFGVLSFVQSRPFESSN